MPVVRTAHAGDASRLAELAEPTFRAAFAAMNTPESVRLHRETSHGEATQARGILDPAATTLICENEGEMIAFAKLRRGSAPPPRGAARRTPGRFA